MEGKETERDVVRKALVPIVVFALIIAGSLAIIFSITAFRKDKVAIIDLRGELVTGEKSFFGTSTGELQRSLENALRDERIKAVVLRVDSPGGTATASYEMYSMVRRFEKPIVAFVRGTGASGSYLVSLGADSVIAHPFSEVGSIGVFIQLRKPVPLEPENAEEIEIISSGKFKTLWEDGVLDENERKFLELKVEEIENSFFEIVYYETRVERAENVEENIENITYQLLEGGWFGGDKAFELGLTDDLGDLEDSIKLASELAGVERVGVEVIEIATPDPGTYSNMFYETSLSQDNEEPVIYLK